MFLNATKEQVIELAHSCAEDDAGATGDRRAYGRKFAIQVGLTHEMENVFVDACVAAMEPANGYA